MCVGDDCSPDQRGEAGRGGGGSCPSPLRENIFLPAGVAPERRSTRLRQLREAEEAEREEFSNNGSNNGNNSNSNNGNNGSNNGNSNNDNSNNGNSNNTQFSMGSNDDNGAPPKKRIRRCQHPGCKKSPRAGGRCIQHGGTRRECTHPGCKKWPQVGGRCVEHGGGGRCNHPGCKKLPRLRGLCSEHAGIKRKESERDIRRRRNKKRKLQKDCREVKRIVKGTGSKMDTLVNGDAICWHGSTVPPEMLELKVVEGKSQRVIMPYSMLSPDTQAKINDLQNIRGERVVHFDVFYTKDFLHACRFAQEHYGKMSPYDVIFVYRIIIPDEYYGRKAGLEAGNHWRTKGLRGVYRCAAFVKYEEVLRIQVGRNGLICDPDSVIEIVGTGDRVNLRENLNENTAHYNDGLLMMDSPDSDDEFIGPPEYSGGDKVENDKNKVAMQESREAKKKDVHDLISKIVEKEGFEDDIDVDFIKLSADDCKRAIATAIIDLEKKYERERDSDFYLNIENVKGPKAQQWLRDHGYEWVHTTDYGKSYSKMITRQERPIEASAGALESEEFVRATMQHTLKSKIQANENFPGTNQVRIDLDNFLDFDEHTLQREIDEARNNRWRDDGKEIRLVEIENVHETKKQILEGLGYELNIEGVQEVYAKSFTAEV